MEGTITQTFFHLFLKNFFSSSWITTSIFIFSSIFCSFFQFCSWLTAVCDIAFKIFNLCQGKKLQANVIRPLRKITTTILRNIFYNNRYLLHAFFCFFIVSLLELASLEVLIKVDGFIGKILEFYGLQEWLKKENERCKVISFFLQFRFWKKFFREKFEKLFISAEHWCFLIYHSSGWMIISAHLFKDT